MTLRDAPFGKLLDIGRAGAIFVVKIAQFQQDFVVTFEPCGDNESESIFSRHCNTECRIVENLRIALVDAVPEPCQFCGQYKEGE